MSADITKPETWYELKLGDIVKIDSMSSLTRVPGGWLMWTFDPVDNVGAIETFIPFSDEFREDK